MSTAAEEDPAKQGQASNGHADLEGMKLIPSVALVPTLLGIFPKGFKESGLEEEFAAGQRQDLQLHLKRVGRAVVLPVIALAAYWASESLGQFHVSYVIPIVGFVLALLLLAVFATLSSKLGELHLLLCCNLLVVAVLMCDSYRAAFLTGANIDDMSSSLVAGALSNDVYTVSFIAIITSGFYACQIRCSRSVFFVFSAPLLYAALTLALPGGDLRQRITVTVYLAALACVCFLLRSGNELRDRRHFLQIQNLQKELKRERDEREQERALRQMAEFRAEQAELKAESSRHGNQGDTQTITAELYDGKEKKEVEVLESTGADGDLDGEEEEGEHVSKVRTALKEAQKKANLDEAIFRPLAGQKTLLQLQALERFAENEGWRMPFEQVEISKDVMLGKGGFGRVMAGRHVSTDVAVKLHDVDSFIGYKILLNELCLLRNLRHPNIVSFYGAAVDAKQGQLCLIIERIGGLSMRDLHAQGNFRVVDTPMRLRILIGVNSALIYLHELTPPIVHGDLQHANVILEANGRPRLIDFGASRMQDDAEGDGTRAGTVRWMAPEVLKGASHISCSADIYSFGRLAFFVVTGNIPLSDLRKDDLKKQLPRLDPERDFKSVKADLPFQKLCRKLCSRCLLADPSSRPAARDVMDELSTWWKELQQRGSPIDIPFEQLPPIQSLCDVMHKKGSGTPRRAASPDEVEVLEEEELDFVSSDGPTKYKDVYPIQVNL